MAQATPVDGPLDKEQAARAAALREARAILARRSGFGADAVDPDDLVDVARFILDGNYPMPREDDESDRGLEDFPSPCMTPDAEDYPHAYAREVHSALLRYRAENGGAPLGLD